jgi:hypothetical protein
MCRNGFIECCRNPLHTKKQENVTTDTHTVAGASKELKVYTRFIADSFA